MIFTPFTVAKNTLEQFEKASVSSASFLPEALQASVIGFQEVYFDGVRKGIETVETFFKQMTPSK